MNMQMLVKTPHTVVMLLESLDDLSPNSVEYTANTSTTGHRKVILNFDVLQYRRLWIYTLLAKECENISVSNKTELSMFNFFGKCDLFMFILHRVYPYRHA